MATELENTDEILVPEPVFLTEEESLAIREREALEKFGMTLDEFFEAWKAGKFDDTPENHVKSISLAMTFPEAWDFDDK